MNRSSHGAGVNVHVYALALTTPFRGITVREGVLISGARGWGEFSPFTEYDDAQALPWLHTAWEAALTGWPSPVRDRVPVNAIVPAVGPQEAFDLVSASGCSTAKVKVAERGGTPAQDEARVEAVRAALGPQGAVRIDANAAWDVETAVRQVRLLDTAAGGLQYAEQPCATLAELAAVRRRVDVPIAADESIRRAADPLAVALAGAADIAVIKCAPLGGVRRALAVAQACGLPCVVSSALETSVGLAAELALAAALPDLEYACGLGTLSLLRADVVPADQSLSPVGGYLTVPAAPPVPRPDLLDAARPADPARTRWWLDRLDRVGQLAPAGQW
jgi:O-succinylbenzoate synthase